MAAYTRETRIGMVQPFYTNEYISNLEIVPFLQNNAAAGGVLVPAWVGTPPLGLIYGGSNPLPLILAHPYKIPHHGNNATRPNAILAVADFMQQNCPHHPGYTWQQVFDECLSFLHYHAPNYPTEVIARGGKNVCHGTNGAKLKREMPTHYNNAIAHTIAYFAYKEKWGKVATLLSLGNPIRNNNYANGFSPVAMEQKEIHLCFVIPMLAMVKQVLNYVPDSATDDYTLVNTAAIMNKTLSRFKAEMQGKAELGLWSQEYIVEEWQQGNLDGTNAGDFDVAKGVYYPYWRLYTMFQPNVKHNTRMEFLTDNQKTALGTDINATVVGQVVPNDQLI